MSDVHGLIPHQTGYYYITLEEDYVLMFQRSADRWFEQSPKTKEDEKNYAARKAHAVAKAYISSVLEQLSDKQFKQGIQEKRIWVYLSFPEIETRVHGGVKQRTLKSAMREMYEDGYVDKRDNPDQRYRTKIYHMNFKQYRDELNALPKRDGADDSADMHDDTSDTDHSANTHDGSANLHDHDANTHDGSADMHPRITNRDNKDRTQNKEGEIATSNEDRNAPANITDFEEKRQRRGDTDKHKAVKIGENHADTDHSTDSTLLPGEHHSDTVSEDICKTRQDDGASSQRHAQEAESKLDTPSSLGTLAPAQRSESLSPHAAVQGADKRKGKRKPGSVPDAQPVPKCDTREIQKRINEHRGYALEEDTEIIRERKAIKTWCNLHTLEEYSFVMQGLKKDRYWGKDENYYRIGGLILLKETPGILAKRNHYPLKAVANGDVAPQEDDDYSDFDIYKGNGKEERAAMRELYEVMKANGELI